MYPPLLVILLMLYSILLLVFEVATVKSKETRKPPHITIVRLGFFTFLIGTCLVAYELREYKTSITPALALLVLGSINLLGIDRKVYEWLKS